MSEVIYVDTNIFLDWIFNRENGRYATQFFERAIECEFSVVISNLTLYELHKFLNKDQIDTILDTLRVKVSIVKVTKEDLHAGKCFAIHYPDNVHLALSKKYAQRMLSNDTEILALECDVIRCPSPLI